jgi:hypothetical protein
VTASNEIFGVVKNVKGESCVSIKGHWDTSIYKFYDSAPNNLEIIWRANPLPSNSTNNYGFTSFALELNELTPDLCERLPPTDTRLRLDQRLYEEVQFFSFIFRDMLIKLK